MVGSEVNKKKLVSSRDYGMAQCRIAARNIASVYLKQLDGALLLTWHIVTKDYAKIQIKGCISAQTLASS